MNNYPSFSVNGTKLTESQNMTVWVALQNFGLQMELDPLNLGDDEHGRTMAKLYLQSVRSINEVAHKPLDLNIRS